VPTSHLYIGDDTGLLKKVNIVFRVKDEQIEEEPVDRKQKIEKDSDDSDDNDDQKSNHSNSEEDKPIKKKDKEAPIEFNNGKTVIARSKLVEKFGY
jgi:hypothetical protein